MGAVKKLLKFNREIFPPLHPFVYFLIVGTVFSRAAFFMSMPFLAVYMKSILGSEYTTIGLVIALGPLLGLVGGFFVSFLSDKLGRRGLMLASMFLWVFVFWGFSMSSSVWSFAFFHALNGFCRACFEPISAALISDLTEEKRKKSAFHLRYFAINVGGAIGPLLGAWVLINDASLGFKITSSVYMVYFLAAAYFSKQYKIHNNNEAIKSNENLSSVLKILANDKALKFFLSGFVLMAIGYSQIEATLPQVLKLLMGEEGIKLFGILFSINALTVCFFQLPMNYLTRKMNLLPIMYLGLSIYSLGFALISILGFSPVQLMISMFVLTLGEILVFSNGRILIDHLAPQHLKGSYFGAANFGALGFSIGPALGGILLDTVGFHLMFMILASTGLLSLCAYLLGGQAMSTQKKLAWSN